ncbi:MAG: hypothetical protein IPK63_16775 [Candidatus Competibacteraceae bacterium]|nr:hypothetical protein [Candidatus Competibacteraceae bacterium]
MTWFERLTGFSEISPDQVRQQIHLRDGVLTSLTNGKTYRYGRLETPSLGELRDRLSAGKARRGQLAIREIVADVQDLHTDPDHAGALFQVASQFNLLEMMSPGVTPEQGIGIYQDDRTQGPASAIAAGAGTIYRNYFVPIQGQIGQSTAHQIDCLADLGAALGNANARWWRMQNGYVFSSREALVQLSSQLSAANGHERDQLRALLRIGVQWDTQVTLKGCQHTVTQAYCSALPVSYSPLPAELWEPLARLVLEAAYEATLCAAILNAANTGNRSLFLTMLGGGAFGNASTWILSAIERALRLYPRCNLDIAIVSHGASKPAVRQWIEGCLSV